MRPEVDLQHQRDINALTRQTVIWTLASAAVGAVGVFSVILYFDPSLLQTPTEQRRYYQGIETWLMFGASFIVLAVWWIYGLRRWRSHLLRILETATPQPARIRLEIKSDSDSTDYFALVSLDGSLDAWEVSLISPSWNVRTYTGQVLFGLVYVDDHHLPTVIKTDSGLLWRMSNSTPAHLAGPLELTR
jgi:hypothetical protein